MKKQDNNNIERQSKIEPCQHELIIWPPRPERFTKLLTPIEAAQYLRLDETGNHTPQSAIRTLKYWRDRGQLKATKFARRVWYRKTQLDEFLSVKTEE